MRPVVREEAAGHCLLGGASSFPLSFLCVCPAFLASSDLHPGEASTASALVHMQKPHCAPIYSFPRCPCVSRLIGSRQVAGGGAGKKGGHIPPYRHRHHRKATSYPIVRTRATADNSRMNLTAKLPEIWFLRIAELVRVLVRASTFCLFHWLDTVIGLYTAAAAIPLPSRRSPLT